MSDLIEMRCPNCGAPIKVVGDDPTMECPFCSTVVMIPPELRKQQPAPQESPWTAFAQMAAAAEAVEEAKAAGAARAAAPPIAAPRKKTSSLGGCVMVLLLFAVIGAIGFLTQGPGRSISNTGGLVAKPTATALPISRELASTLPRSVDYAGFGIQITQGVIDNKQDRDGEVSYLRDGAFARLDGTLQNATRESLYLDAQLFKLRLGDGKMYKLDPSMVLSKNFTAPDPGASNSVSFVFPVPFDAKWDGAVLVVNDGTGEPAELPLTGDAPKALYPQTVAVPSTAEMKVGDIGYQLTGVSLDLNSGSKRAEKGKRFLNLDLHMTNHTGKYGINVSSDNFRLIANGSSVSPVVFPIAVIDYQSSLDGRVVFEVPDGADTVTVQFGDVRAENVKFAKVDLNIK